MSDALIVGVITAGVSLIGIFVSAKSTRDKITAEIMMPDGGKPENVFSGSIRCAQSVSRKTESPRQQ